MPTSALRCDLCPAFLWNAAAGFVIARVRFFRIGRLAQRTGRNACAARVFSRWGWTAGSNLLQDWEIYETDRSSYYPDVQRALAACRRTGNGDRDSSRQAG